MKNYAKSGVIIFVAGVALYSSAYTTGLGNKAIRGLLHELGAPSTHGGPLSADSSAPPAVLASPAQEKKVEESFTGSHLKAEEAVKGARLIVIGKFVDVGHISFDGAGRTYHENAKVEVLRTLKGDHSGPLSVSFTVREAPPSPAEKSPEPNQSYIIVIDQGPSKASKILPDTDENFKTVMNHIHTVSSKTP